MVGGGGGCLVGEAASTEQEELACALPVALPAVAMQDSGGLRRPQTAPAVSTVGGKVEGMSCEDDAAQRAPKDGGVSGRPTKR